MNLLIAWGRCRWAVFLLHHFPMIVLFMSTVIIKILWYNSISDQLEGQEVFLCLFCIFVQKYANNWACKTAQADNHVLPVHNYTVTVLQEKYKSWSSLSLNHVSCAFEFLWLFVSLSRDMHNTVVRFPVFWLRWSSSFTHQHLSWLLFLVLPLPEFHVLFSCRTHMLFLF